jgi:RNA polymerase sigma factor (sigma-70 family)
MVDDSSHTTLIQDCLTRLRAGDRSARDALIDYSCDRLHRLAHRMLRGYPRVQRWEETSDVRQNATVRLLRALAEVEPASVDDFMRLAAACIRRELIDLARHYYGPEGMGTHHQSDRLAAGGSASGDPRQAVERAAAPASSREMFEIHELVSQLPAAESEVFQLRYYLDCTHREVAELLGLPEITVRRRWQSARVLLHDALKKLESRL